MGVCIATVFEDSELFRSHRVQSHLALRSLAILHDPQPQPQPHHNSPVMPTCYFSYNSSFIHPTTAFLA